MSFGQLEGFAELDEDRQGDIFFVTISEPKQSILSWWAAGGGTCGPAGACAVEPEIDFLTRVEKYGRETPDQRRQISLQMMRTSSQEAQYVALRALGYDDVSIRPGRGRRRGARLPRAGHRRLCPVRARRRGPRRR